FLANESGMTTAQKGDYKSYFNKMKHMNTIGGDVANEILSKLFQKDVGAQLSSLSFDYVNNEDTTLEPLRKILDNHRDDFLPDLNIEWDDLEIETLLEKNDLETRWHFNLPTLAEHVEGVNSGHLIVGGARPNTGKTSFHASIVAGPNGFASQGAKCVILCNEEATHRVGARYLTAASGMTMREIRDNPREAQSRWAKLKENIKIKDATGQSMHWVELVCKTYNPDVVILDMGDKFAPDQSHEGLKLCAIHARQIAKEYDCAIFYMSQLSAEAEGRTTLNQSMMEGSKTGKASEADLMLLIAKDLPIEGMEDDGFSRHINVAKNKLTGWHGKITCKLNYYIGRYEV
ncbi:DnaB helicase C-terminal domain-containing protein, partial [bacterium]|nr:DnaB helicase C-terminal domain-containing protein [bacterium]